MLKTANIWTFAIFAF